MYETLIIGAGIAGCTAAIYASRKRMRFLVVAREFGGQFFESGQILNYPGIKETTGADFADMLQEQLDFNKIALNTGEEVNKIEVRDDGGFLVTSNREVYQAQTVIITTGSRPRKLRVPGEDKFMNKGVTYCSVCDGPLFADKEIAVIGGGNSALEGVDFVQRIAKKIHLINIGETFTGHESLIETVNSYDNVDIIHNAETLEIFGGKTVQGLKYKKGGETRELAVEGVIVEIGREPNTGFVKGFLELNEKEHIVIDCMGNASRKGVFAAGDCASGNEYQYAIAAGQGCIALLKAARYLANGFANPHPFPSPKGRGR